MKDEAKKPKLFEPDHEVSKVLMEWWENLKMNKGDRAELRRCKSLEELQQTSAYQRCCWRLINTLKKNEPHMKPSREQWAIIIGLATHIEENRAQFTAKDGEMKPHYFGWQIAEGQEKPKLSELRFRRLLKINKRVKLFRFLIQVIRLLDKKVNLLDLARMVFYWGETTKTNLAYQYYEKAKLE